ncbi:MAG TPA: histone deacetylase [Polyangiaceae bacterium]|nr:histone deacetylase [Polyangiaceae bacterium]
MDAVLVDDALFLEHRPRTVHPERPERLVAARRAVDSVRDTLRFTQLAARDASDEELGRVHTRSYLDTLGRLSGQWGDLDPDTYVSPQSIAAARRAAGGSIELVDALLARRAALGLALVRPPGHHARPSMAMGFCLLNNVAIAAAHARARGVERVLIVDWDVHHGNGTEEMFYEDPTVLYVSLHQAPYYPGSGAVSDVGAGSGTGYTVNIPLPPGASDAVYLEAFKRVVAPIIDAFRPDLALVSAGFDPHVRDPIGGMAVTDGGFAALARELRTALPETCPAGLVLEGGYDTAGLEGGLRASLLALAGASSPEPEPGTVSGPYAAAIERARAAQAPFFRLG